MRFTVKRHLQSRKDISNRVLKIIAKRHDLVGCLLTVLDWWTGFSLPAVTDAGLLDGTDASLLLRRAR